jgi:heterotetrameric sarcosine oxidase gamma subunit
MDDPHGRPSAFEADGWSVRVQPGLQIASLRYFDRTGSFAAAVGEAVGRPLPECLRAIQVEDPTNAVRFLLAWRSPTETLLVCESRAAFAELERRLATLVDGCMVDQTGGVSVLRVQGARAADVLLRLGAATAIPRLGESLSGRLADVHVLAACIRAGEFLLFVERVFTAHLLEWMGTTAADFR